MLALICLIIAIPLDAFIGFIADEFGSKRPDLEMIGLSTVAWIGGVPAPPPNGAADMSAIGKLFQAVDAAESSRRSDAILEDNSDGHVITEEEKKEAEIHHVAKEVFNDFISPEEEVKLIMMQVKDFLSADVEAPWKSSLNAGAAQRSAKIKAIMNYLKVYPNGNPAPLSILEFLQYGDSRNMLKYKIEQVRNKAQSIAEEIAAYTPEEMNFKDCVLIQHFILEQMTFLKRFALNKQFFVFEGAPPETINPIVWIIAWIFLFGSHGMFVYWMFAWGTKNGTATVEHWGMNFIVGFVQDAFGMQIIRIYLVYIVAVDSMRPQLRGIHRTLKNIAMTYVQDGSDKSGDIRVCQHLSAACRAARMHEGKDLSAAAILRQLDDYDIECCRDNRNNKMGVIIFWLIAIPTCIALFSEFLSDQVIDIAIPTCISYTALGFSMLFEMENGVLLLCMPFVGIVLYFWYKYCMFVPAIAYIKAKGSPVHTTHETNTTKRWQQSRRLRSRESPIAFIRDIYIKTWDVIATVVFFFSYDGFMARMSTSKTDGTWKSMNRPAINQGKILNELQLADQARNDKIQKSNRNSSSKADIIANIPRQIIALTPADWLTTWQSKDGAIINYINKYKFNTMFKDDIEEAHTTANDEKTLFNNVKHSKIAQQFRDSQITTNITIALKRMLKEHLGNTTTNNDNDDHYFSLVLGQEDHNPFLYSSEYIALLSKVWGKFYPGGYQLSAEEEKEVVEQFLSWMITNDPLNRTGTSFNNFKIWFNDMCNTLIHVRSMLNDRQVIVNDTHKATASHANSNSNHTNDSDYSVFGGGNDKGGLKLETLGNTFATLPVVRGEKVNEKSGHVSGGGGHDSAWVASDSSGSGSQSDSDDFAFETYK